MSKPIRNTVEIQLDNTVEKMGEFWMSIVFLFCGVCAIFMPSVPMMTESQATLGVVGIFFGLPGVLGELLSKVKGQPTSQESISDPR